MNIIGPIYAERGVALRLFFSLEDGATTDIYIAGDVVAADSARYNYTTGVSGVTTNAVNVVASPFMFLDLTAAEMDGENIAIIIRDVSGSAYKDLLIIIRTYLKVSTHNLFDLSEVSEPSTTLASVATFKEILQHLKRRWFNRHEVVNGQLKVYKDNSTTVLDTQTVTNTESEKSIGKAS